ncbi:MAG: hypothetical protein KGH72_04760 [Candidatus Micrarchaeota archaeon]|nr:hypothetical protein [Candidatus Micrarchaeota archaeon]
MEHIITRIALLAFFFGCFQLAFAGTAYAASQYTVQVASNAIFGTYLANSTGWALYINVNDTPGSSMCDQSCASVWIPFYSASLNLPAKLNASNFSSINRTGGGKQLTYLGHPLYTYAYDTGQGSTKGQGSGGAWYLMSIYSPVYPNNTTITTVISIPNRGQRGVTSATTALQQTSTNATTSFQQTASDNGSSISPIYQNNPGGGNWTLYAAAAVAIIILAAGAAYWMSKRKR